MEDEPWWPRGIAISSMDEALEVGKLETKWGAASCWDIQACLQSDWWVSQRDGTWGVFDEIDPSTIEVVRTDGNRTLIKLDESYLALAYSIPTSNRTSSLHQNKDIHSMLQSSNLHLPIGGMLLNGKDALVVFPAGILTEPSPEWLGQTLGNIQRMLAPMSSPNDEKRWNQRLKDLEDELKPNTLWRAPHASVTKGIPPVRIHPNYIVEIEGEHRALPLNQTVSEALLCGTERLPELQNSYNWKDELLRRRDTSLSRLRFCLRTGSVAFQPLGQAAKRSQPFLVAHGFGDITTFSSLLLNRCCTGMKHATNRLRSG